MPLSVSAMCLTDWLVGPAPGTAWLDLDLWQREKTVKVGLPLLTIRDTSLIDHRAGF